MEIDKTKLNIRAWELIVDNSEYQSHTPIEHIGVEDVIEGFFGEY